MTAHITRRLSALLHFSLAALPRLLLSAEAQRRSRRALLKLDDHLLRDIGLTHLEAVDEANRSFWDPPLHWKD